MNLITTKVLATTQSYYTILVRFKNDYSKFELNIGINDIL